MEYVEKEINGISPMNVELEALTNLPILPVDKP